MQTFLNKLQSWWITVVVKIRSLLPEDLNQKLSNTALTGVFTAAAVVVVGISSVLPTQSSAMADVSPAEQLPTANIATPPEITAPEAPQPVEPIPIVMTPEEKLIVSVKDQIAEITEQYADGLIQSIQPSFQGNSLTVEVGNDWYNFDRAQQDKTAARMLIRAKESDFSRLEITDSQGTLLARSPVVGNEMVILKRHLN